MAQGSRGKRVGQDAQQFGMALALLVKYYDMKDDFMDSHRVRIYEHGLAKVPGPLVMAAAMRATETRKWFPKVSELLFDAEACRRELLAEHPYLGCAECEDQLGWRTVLHPDGAKVERCRCRERWLSKLTEMGVTPQPLALPAAAEDDAA